MCLYRRMTTAQEKEIKDTITKDGITVYKVVCSPGILYTGKNTRFLKEGYYSPYGKMTTGDRMHYSPYEDGVNYADEDTKLSIKCDRTIVESIKMYKSGFHFLRDREAAKRLQKDTNGFITTEVIECTIKKSWITRIGYETIVQDKEIATLGYTEEVVIVTKKAIFPKFSRKI